jgi:hypothetical protein
VLTFFFFSLNFVYDKIIVELALKQMQYYFIEKQLVSTRYALCITVCSAFLRG